jgi:hypothetical protein
MENTIYPIETPFSINIPCSTLRIAVVSITPFVGATISVGFYDGLNRRRKRVYLEITGVDYAEWFNDYSLVDYVAQKLDLTGAFYPGDY